MKSIILLRQWTWVKSRIFYFPFVPFTADLDGWDRITPKFSFDNDKILWLEVKETYITEHPLWQVREANTWAWNDQWETPNDFYS